MAIKVNPVNFVVAQNSGLVLHAAKSTQLIAKGIQGLGLMLGFTMDTITVVEMGRRIALVIPSGGSYEPTVVNSNFVPGDPSQTELQQAALNSTLINDARQYIKMGCSFSAPDLISDPASGFYVGSYTDPSVDSPSGLYTNSISLMAAGPFCLFVAHKTGTDLSYVAATRTLSSASSDFVDLGFEAGDTAILDYMTVSTDPKFLQIESVTASTIVFTDAVGDIADLTDFSGIATTALHAATPTPVSGFASGCD